MPGLSLSNFTKCGRFFTELIFKMNFYRAMVCIADYAVARCLVVCPSIRHDLV